MKQKKIIRYLTLTLVIVLIALSCFAVSGCCFSPTKIERWYIRHVIENGKTYYPGTEDYYNGTLLSSDYLVFSFKEDGTVTITDLNGNERKGTFTEKGGIRARATKVTVNLSDGTILTGSCGKFSFDGTWYEFILSDGYTTYELTDENNCPKKSQEGAILKEIYSEIASLSAAEIKEINYVIENGVADLTLTDAADKENFLSAFSTASFGGRRLTWGDIDYYDYNSGLLTIKTDNSEYEISLLVHEEYKKVYIKYNSEAYQLRDDFATWLLSFFTVQTDEDSASK